MKMVRENIGKGQVGHEVNDLEVHVTNVIASTHESPSDLSPMFSP